MVITVLVTPVIAQIRTKQRVESSQKLEGEATAKSVELRWE
jgi:hypothetical protein